MESSRLVFLIEMFRIKILSSNYQIIRRRKGKKKKKKPHPSSYFISSIPQLSAGSAVTVSFCFSCLS